MSQSIWFFTVYIPFIKHIYYILCSHLCFKNYYKHSFLQILILYGIIVNSSSTCYDDKASKIRRHLRNNPFKSLQSSQSPDESLPLDESESSLDKYTPHTISCEGEHKLLREGETIMKLTIILDPNQTIAFNETSESNEVNETNYSDEVDETNQTIILNETSYSDEVDETNQTIIFNETSESNDVDETSVTIAAATETSICLHEGDSCDDGIFCNGEEVCDANLNCVSINPPCPACNQICDEYYGECFQYVVDCMPMDMFHGVWWNKDTCECEYYPKTISRIIVDCFFMVKYYLWYIINSFNSK